MSLISHLLIHIILSLIAGFLVFYATKKPISFVFSLIGGVAVDFDHFIDYFLAFGCHFRLDYFEKGYQFLKSDKIYVLFHAWEYVIIMAVLAYFTRNKLIRAAIISLALGLFFHLGADSALNEGMKPQSYSLIYRTENNFDIERLVTPEHYKNHTKLKEQVKFE